MRKKPTTEDYIALLVRMKLIEELCKDAGQAYNVGIIDVDEYEKLTDRSVSYFRGRRDDVKEDALCKGYLVRDKNIVNVVAGEILDELYEKGIERFYIKGGF